ncbi:MULTISPECIES: ABC transporter substrate-binding protein [unclassified Sinorhizobium]|uniref:ABC transporter substrate-binding protein n=1 Tax=unclassified Sinorhizobium TaxID=2613772 RepID=UPI0024C43AB2|nr:MULTISPECIES: ABC transporter substrate-binding protein [unclassified Sinorhizobium]MDK1378574.1 ABC transporter substrate-binding protein [Sinorhizobium sp. 6-70]MDK1480529.1 ABC transporter substrate-binding protein [Sinorhizobium sp. 6-117]
MNMKVSGRSARLIAATALMVTFGTAAFAQEVPTGYPADYASLIEAAKKEGTVSVYTSTDAAQSQKLQDAFTKKYGIKIAYNDLGTNGAYNQVISEAAAGQTTADVVWSSAMDLQMTLVQDGYASEYASPEAANLPSWANYKNTLFGSTVEPVGVIYNTKALSEDRLPKTYADMITFLKDNKTELQGKVATFDPEKSGSGFLHHSNDARNRSDFWDLAKAMGDDGAKIYSSSGGMKETVVSGENVIAINIIGSYALDWVKESPNLGVHFATDYTPAFSRVILMTKDAPHPNAAKLFIDFMLSQEGQSALAEGGLPSVREDVTAGLNVKTLNERVGGGLKPIAVDEGVLEYMDQMKRVQFLNDWKAALGR